MEPQLNPQPEPLQAAVGQKPKAKHQYVGNPFLQRCREDIDHQEHLDRITDALDEAVSIKAVSGEENLLMRSLLALFRKHPRRYARLPKQKWLMKISGLNEGRLSATSKSLREKKMISLERRHRAKWQRKNLYIELLTPAWWEIDFPESGATMRAILAELEEFNREEHGELNIPVPYGPPPEKLAPGASSGMAQIEKLAPDASFQSEEGEDQRKFQESLGLEINDSVTQDLRQTQVSSDRIGSDRDRSRIDQLLEKVWVFVGEHERKGLSARRFKRFAKMHPAKLEEFLAAGEKAKSAQEIDTPGAWLNAQISGTGLPGFVTKSRPVKRDYTNPL